MHLSVIISDLHIIEGIPFNSETDPELIMTIVYTQYVYTSSMYTFSSHKLHFVVHYLLNNILDSLGIVTDHAVLVDPDHLPLDDLI